MTARILLTLAIALSSGYLVMRLRVPGGMLLGAMLGVMLFNVTAGIAFTPYALRFISQAIAGSCIGCSLRREELRTLPLLWRPLCILVGGMLLTNMLIAKMITLVSPLDSATAILAAMPGGLSETPLMAADMGADVPQVAALQFVRLLVGVGVYPYVIRALDRRKQPVDMSGREKGQGRVFAYGATQKRACRFQHVALTLLAAFSGAFVGLKSGVYAGVLLFSIFFTGAVKLTAGIGEIPKPLRYLAQMFAGAYVGSLMDHDNIVQMRFLLLPAVLLTTLFALNCLMSGWLLEKLCGFKRREAMLATTPAGAGEIALISSDMGVSGGDVTDIVLLHVVRMIAITCVVPQLIPLISRFF